MSPGSTFGLRYHGMPEGEEEFFFLCRELIPGYLSGVTGEYGPPQGYLVSYSKRISPEVCRLPGCLYIKRYNARVNRAVFWSSAQSPLMIRSSSTMSKSPVSKSLGSRFFRKLPTLLLPALQSGFFPGRWSLQGCAQGGGGGGGQGGCGSGRQPSSFGGAGLGGVLLSGIRLRRKVPSGWGI